MDTVATLLYSRFMFRSFRLLCLHVRHHASAHARDEKLDARAIIITPISACAMGQLCSGIKWLLIMNGIKTISSVF